MALTLVVKPYSWDVIHDQASLSSQSKEIDQSHILAWCHDRKDNPVLLRIHDFHYRCYLELPPISPRGQKWDQKSAYDVIDNLNRFLKDDAASSFSFRYTKTLYYY